MTLVAAAACAREASIVVDDPPRERALWERALDALDAASPLVEDAGDGTALLEMRGIAGSARAWLTSVRAALTHDDELRALPLRVALASNPFAARTAARVRDGAIVQVGHERDFVAPLPLRFLELERGTLERLELLGVRTLGELAALPHGPFVRRFGPRAARWHAEACGGSARPLVPRARRITVDRALYGEGTAEREDQVLFALRSLVARVAEDVAFLGKRCGALRLELECEDGETHALETALAQPTADATIVFDLLRARLEGTVLHAAVSGLRLRAERLEEGGTELSLFAGRDPDPQIIALALARLTAALGPQTTLGARIVPGNRYETRIAYDAFSVPPATNRASAASTVRTHAASDAPHAPATATTGTLTYRMLPARRIEVQLQRGRPAVVDSHAVLEYAGPWRVDEGWWRPALGVAGAACVQNAYDVLLDDGVLCRIVDDHGRWHISGMYD